MAEEKEKKTRYHAVEDWMLTDRNLNTIASFKIYFIIRKFTLSGKIGKCVFSLNDFAKQTSLSKPSIIETIKQLSEIGYITIEKDGQRNVYKSVEKPSETSKESLLVKKVNQSKDLTSKESLLDRSKDLTREVKKLYQHPNYDLTKIKLNTNKAVNICLINNTPSQDCKKMASENGKKEETATAEKDTADTADGNTAIRQNGNNGCPTPSDNNPSLSLTDNGKETATADGNTTDGEKATASTAEDKDKEILDRILAERPIEEIIADKLLEIYPQGKIDINRGEVLFPLRNITNLEEETIYLLTLVKETMDINPYYVPKLSRYLDQGSYLQHYRVRTPIGEFSADYLAKKEWKAKMTKDDWKEAGDLLLREFNLGGDGFHDPLPEPSEEEKKEALAWLDSAELTTGGSIK